VPEQASARGNVITSAPFEAPFDTTILPLGVGGLQLNPAADVVTPTDYQRLTNVTHETDRELTARAGLTALATVGQPAVHTLQRVADPEAGTWTRLVGAGGSIYRGTSGALTAIDAGYSGDPLTLVPYRPPLSGDPWVFVADRWRMRKIRMDGLTLPIGLPAPGGACAAVLGDHWRTQIAAVDPNFNYENPGVDDGTAGPNWQGNAGEDFSDPPVATDPGLVPPLGSAEFITVPGSATSAYWTFWGLGINRDLSTVGGQPASDDDLLHCVIKFSHPQDIAEARLYVVVADNFNPGILPGTDPTNAANGDFYVKSFRPADMTDYIQSLQAQIEAAETARLRKLREDSLKDAGTADSRESWGSLWAAIDKGRQIGIETGTGVNEFIELGITGRPLRRGDFQRVGLTDGRDWGTVTGLVLYVQTREDVATPVGFTFIECYLQGGAGPDTSTPGMLAYDWRYTHYDPRTGAESNPSPEMDEGARLDPLRRACVLTPDAYGDGAVRQRFYRRGGSLTADWYYLGENGSDGGSFTDDLTDDAIVTAGTVALDHHQPVSTVSDAGATIDAQAVPVLFGPYDGMLFALGDPHRPGDVYWCLPDQPDHWPPSQHYEVTAPSEPLLAGVVYAGQPYVASADRWYVLYPSLTGTSTDVRAVPTPCTRGPAGRWATCLGPGGIYFLAKDGVFRMQGGAEELLSTAITPLFRGETRHGYAPINFAVPTALRLFVHQDRLWCCYEDTAGQRQVMVYHLLAQTWEHYNFSKVISCGHAEAGVSPASLLLGSATLSSVYTYGGTSDAGDAIACTAQTGDLDLGRPREDKLLGDQILDADMQGVTGTLQNFLNHGTVSNPTQAFGGATGRQRIIFDGFGTTPQKARTVSTRLTWSSDSARPVLYQLGLAVTPQPDMTVNRVTNWDDLGHPDESYVTGITLDADTGGTDRLLYFERDWAGAVSTLHSAIINCAGRHKVKFSWPALPAHKVRIRPDQHCRPWILYKADWISVKEPPRIARWDIHYETDGDQYYTGIDLYCDTGGAEKQIQIEVDGVVLNAPATGLPFWAVTTTRRTWVHLTLPWGRGHVFHLIALDDNPGLLYSHKWYTDPEPSEQTNWNQNFTIHGTRADKWYKGVVLECDTFGQNKTVTLELDGTVVQTLTVNASGRRSLHFSFEQRLGRVFRLFPIDHQPGRLYSWQPIFDEEPFQLARWETQETDHDQRGFQIPIEAQITLKSTAAVTLSLTAYPSQEAHTLVESPRWTETYTLRATNGIKDKRFVPFKARKGVLFKYVFTSDQPFYLYQEESHVLIQPWGAEQPIVVRPFGNADADRTRTMIHSQIAAGRAGGGTA